MPSSIWNKFHPFIEEIAKGNHKFGTDVFSLALTNSAPSPAYATRAQVSEISYAYASDRDLTLNSANQTNGLLRVIFADHIISANGGSVGPFRYLVVYNKSNDKLIGWLDYGSNVTVLDGQSLGVDMPVLGAFTMS